MPAFRNFFANLDKCHLDNHKMHMKENYFTGVDSVRSIIVDAHTNTLPEILVVIHNAHHNKTSELFQQPRFAICNRPVLSCLRAFVGNVLYIC